MLKTLRNAWNVTELKNKLLFTLLIIVIYRLGSNIPVPYVDPHAFDLSVGSIFQYMDLLAGGALSQATLFALSVSPYITSSIVIQLLTVAIPALERLSKEGEEGKRKIQLITRWVTMALSYNRFRLYKGASQRSTHIYKGRGLPLLRKVCLCSSLLLCRCVHHYVARRKDQPERYRQRYLYDTLC